MRRAAPLGAAPTLKHHFTRQLARRSALRMHVVLIVLWSLRGVWRATSCCAAPVLYRRRASRSSTTGTTASSIRIDASGIVAA